MGPVRVAARDGGMPPGLLIDAEGRPTTDPNVMLADPRGALLPVGGHKGYGLMLACELLAGILGRRRHGAAAAERRGRSSTACSPSSSIPRASPTPRGCARRSTRGRVRRLVPPAGPGQPALQPGDPSAWRWPGAGAEGVPMDDAGWRQLVGCGERVGVDVAAALACGSGWWAAAGRSRSETRPAGRPRRSPGRGRRACMNEECGWRYGEFPIGRAIAHVGWRDAPAADLRGRPPASPRSSCTCTGALLQRGDASRPWPTSSACRCCARAASSTAATPWRSCWRPASGGATSSARR